jgi:ATP-dependent 26S proteasome regulatory subunit
MDWYEKEQLERQKRDAEKKHQRELDDAQYEREQQEQATRRAEQAAEQARRYSQSLRNEYDEEREAYAEELQQRTDDVKRLKAEKATIVGALRKLVEAWKGNEHVLNFVGWGPDFMKVHAEAKELLRLIDAGTAAK